MATPQPAPLQTQRAPASPAGLFIAGADKGALAARRTLQPTDQHDDADDRRGDPDLDGTVPVKRAEHWRTLYARFGVSAAQPIAPGLCCSPALSRVWAAPYSAPLLRVTRSVGAPPERYRDEKANVPDRRHLLRRNCIGRSWNRLACSRVSSAGSPAGASDLGLRAKTNAAAGC